MDIMQAVTFIPEEDRWMEKLAIGVGVILVSSVLSIVLVGILGFFILGGYSIRLLQNVRDGRHPILPEWDDWGGDLRRGFKYAVVGFIWGLGIFLLIIPTFLGAAMSGGDSGFVQAMGAMIMVAGICFSMLYAIFLLLAQPGFTIAFAEDEHISSGLELSKVWRWTRGNLGQVVIAAVAIFIASFVINSLAGLVGLILCGVGIFVTAPLAMIVTYIFQFHLFGQLAREFPMDGSLPTSQSAPTPTEPGPESTALIETDKALEADEALAESEASTPSEEEVRDVWAEAEESESSAEDADQF